MSGVVRFTFGKYAGKPISLIVRWYPRYCLWTLATLSGDFWSRHANERRELQRRLGALLHKQAAGKTAPVDAANEDEAVELV